MLEIDISHQSAKFLKKLDPKQKRQIAEKILDLSQNPNAFDSKTLKGFPKIYRRSDVGEYRIVYTVKEKTLYVFLVDKRNDREVYRIMERKFQ